MSAQDPLVRFLCLAEELETSRELLKSGFGNLQEIDMGRTFYHLPHQLMASGLERLMKCYISLVHKGRHGSYPDVAMMRNLGHDLEKLLAGICKDYFGGTRRPFVADDLAFVTGDHALKECVRILALFGRMGRYYNLDVVAGASGTVIDPKGEWQTLETSVADPAPYMNDLPSLHRDYYPRVHGQLIAKMERLIRAIALQFTLGDHVDPSGDIRRLSGVYADFRNLRTNQFGTTDYRRSVEILNADKDSWVRRSEEEIAGSRWPTRSVGKAEFEGDWPFRQDHVAVECREKLFYVVNVQGYDFALNGHARSRFGFPDVHDAGVAILGKSVGPFIEMAAKLAA